MDAKWEVGCGSRRRAIKRDLLVRCGREVGCRADRSGCDLLELAATSARCAAAAEVHAAIDSVILAQPSRRYLTGMRTRHGRLSLTSIESHIGEQPFWWMCVGQGFAGPVGVFRFGEGAFGAHQDGHVVVGVFDPPGA